MDLKLYEHNKIAYKKASDILEDIGKTCVVHPTGTGKSYIAFQLVLDHPSSHFIWLSPSEYIYRLQINQIEKNHDITFQNIEFHTYVWLLRNTSKIEELKADYIILDEFHRVGASEWGRCVDALLKHLPNAKLLGLSATPVRYLDQKRDMAKELFGGSVASEMDICEAMAREILPLPKYIVSLYSYKEKLEEYSSRIEKMTNARQKSESLELLERLRRSLEKADGVDKILEKHIENKKGRYIVFCSSSDHMLEMMSKAKDWFKGVDTEPHVYHVYTYNPDSEADFRGFIEDKSDHLKLLYAIDMLNEGIHVEGVDGVVLLRPTVSPIVYKQQIGRALNAGESKRPLIFDLVNSFDGLINIESLKEEFEALCAYYGYNDAYGYGELEGFEIIDEIRESRELFLSLQRYLGSSWEANYKELELYYKRNGHIRISKSYISESGFYLGRWLLGQRHLRNEGALSEERVKALNRFGMIWGDYLESQFSRWLDILAVYKDGHGDTFVSAKYKTEDGEALGNWCTNVRSAYKRGQLSKDKIDKLNDIGFAWEGFDIYWYDGYDHAKAYLEEKGDIDVKKRYICEDGFKLGLWLATQRRVRECKIAGNLTEEKIALLDELGMIWEKDADSIFEKNLSSFERYKEEYGTPMVVSTYIDKDDIHLGTWTMRMRRERREGKLKDEYIKRLDEAGFAWENAVKRGRRKKVESV